MEPKTKKQKLQTALRLIRKQYMDSIEVAIRTEVAKSYSTIAVEHGVSRQFVLDTAQKRGCGRATPSEEEQAAEDCQFGDRKLMNTTQPIEVTEHEARLLTCGLLGGVIDPSVVVADAQHEQAADVAEVSND